MQIDKTKNLKKIQEVSEDITKGEIMFPSPKTSYMEANNQKDEETCPKFQHGIRACRIQGPHTYTHTKPKRSAGRQRGTLGKSQIPHRIDKILDKSL